MKSNTYCKIIQLVSNNCPINVYGQAWTLIMTMPYARCAGDCQRICTGQRCGNKYPTLGRAANSDTTAFTYVTKSTLPTTITGNYTYECQPSDTVFSSLYRVLEIMTLGRLPG